MPKEALSLEAVADAEAAADAHDDPAFVEDKGGAAEDEGGLGERLQRQADAGEAGGEEDAGDKAAGKGKKEPAVEEAADPLDLALQKKGEKKGEEAVEEEDPSKQFEGVEEAARSEKMRQNIVNMRKLIGEQFKTIKQTKAEVEAARKSGAGKAPPELEKALATAQAEAKQLREAIMAIDVKESPEYRAKFVDGRKGLVQKAASRVKLYGGKPEDFEEALSMPEGKRRTEALREALDGVEPDDRGRIYSVIEQITALDDEAAEISQNSGKAYEEYEAGRQQARAKHEEQLAAQRKEAYGKIAADLGEKSPFLALLDPTKKGAADWNKAVQADIDAGMQLFSADTPFESHAEAAIKSRAFDRVEKIALEERAARKAAEAKLAEYEGATPGRINSNRRAKSKDEEGDDDLPLGERLQRKADARSRED